MFSKQISGANKVLHKRVDLVPRAQLHYSYLHKKMFFKDII